jgi:hypothetical protein
MRATNNAYDFDTASQVSQPVIDAVDAYRCAHERQARAACRDDPFDMLKN